MSSRKKLSNVGQNNRLTVNETTVLNQLKDRISTGNYEEEQYQSLLEGLFKQHPSLKKNGKVIRDRQISKILEVLQVYLEKQNSFDIEGNEEKLAHQNVAECEEGTPTNTNNPQLKALETTVLNQVIEEIKTGKYKPEQYSNLLEEHFKQHQSWSKIRKEVQDKQISKLLDKLQVYLDTQNDLKVQKNEKQPAQCDEKTKVPVFLECSVKLERIIPKNLSKKSTPSNVGNRHLTVYETTVLNQVLSEIRTGKYKPEQYQSLIKEYFKQHPSLRKTPKSGLERRIKKLLDALHTFLISETNSEEKGNETPGSSGAQTPTSADDTSEKTLKTQRQENSEFELSNKENEVKLSKLQSRFLQRSKSVSVEETAVEESMDSEIYTIQNGRKSVIVDLEESTKNEDIEQKDLSSNNANNTDKTESIGLTDTQSSLFETDDYDRSDSFICNSEESEVINIGESSSEEQDNEENENYDSDTESDIFIDLTSDDLKVEAGENTENKQSSEDGSVKDESLKIEENNVSCREKISLDPLTVSTPKKRRSLSLKGNMQIDDGCNNTPLSQRINDLVQLLGSTVKEGKFSLNLSVNQKEPEPLQEEGVVNSQSQKQEISPQFNGKKDNEITSQTDNELTIKKRCLDRSLSEVLTDNANCKRMKVNVVSLDLTQLNQDVISSDSVKENGWRVSPISTPKPSTYSKTRVKPPHKI